MQELLRSANPWLTFGGSILVVAALYWSQALVVPIALAVLITFLLNPPVSQLQPRIGRVPSVLVVVTLTFTLLGLAGWGLTHQVSSLVQELPGYRDNIRAKIRDVRQASKGGSVQTIQETVADIDSEINKGETRGSSAQPVIVNSKQVESLWGLPIAIGAWLEPVATAGFVVVLVIFMLLERQALRNRLISLVGHGQLAVTTKALDEAGHRVSTYLLNMSLMNLAFGAVVGAALYLLGVPYVLLWAALAAALRFIPYVGPWIAAAAAILVCAAAFDGWSRPFLVFGLFVALELVMNLVVETHFYAGAAGVSQVGLLTAVAFWTWLWGPLGLLMATPLTVCIVVLGKHVRGLDFVTKLFADEPSLDSDASFYQRLLSGDQAEAAELIEQHLTSAPAESLYDDLMLPALNYAERDRIAGRLSRDEEDAVVAGLRELVDGFSRTRDTNRRAIVVIGCPIHGEADALALHLLEQLLGDAPIALQILETPTHVSEVVRAVSESGCRAICLADLPPSGPSKSRYLIKRLRAAAPDLQILVGRWSPADLADESFEALRQAGADHVSSKLHETGSQLRNLLSD